MRSMEEGDDKFAHQITAQNTPGLVVRCLSRGKIFQTKNISNGQYFALKALHC